MSIETRCHQYGKVFDHWQIKDRLGQGSGGKSMVFRLERTDARWGTCALKSISLIEEEGKAENIAQWRYNEYLVAREECTRKAEMEVRLMDDLKGNTNIVDYMDHTFVDWTDETGFGRDMLIRMELLKDLRGEIRSDRVFTRDEIIRLGLNICSALERCHGKNIIHRDIKPENIFINKDGDYKLGDFGISRILSASPMAMASTGIGTPQYAAPEQFNGQHDRRVDIYSLGLVLYELANEKRLPFATGSFVRPEDVVRRTSGTPLPRPQNADDALAEVILKACEFSAENRYRTAREFADALRGLLGEDSPLPIPSVLPVPISSPDNAPGMDENETRPAGINKDADSAPGQKEDAPDEVGYGTRPAGGLKKSDEEYGTQPAGRPQKPDEEYGTQPADRPHKPANGHGTKPADSHKGGNKPPKPPKPPISKENGKKPPKKNNQTGAYVIIGILLTLIIGILYIFLRPQADHEHVYDRQVAQSAYLSKAATCEAPAEYYVSCECGEKGSQTFVYGSAKGHSFAQKVDNAYLKTAAGCGEPAEYYLSCECGAVSTQTFTYGNANGHNYVENVSSAYLKSAATCDQPAEYYLSCECGAVSTQTFTYGSAKGHNYGKNVNSRYLKSGATCDQPAEYYLSCECGAVSTQTFTYGSANGHNYVQNVSSAYLKTPATCEEPAEYYLSCACGDVSTRTFTYGAPKGHVFDRKIVSSSYLRRAASCQSPAEYYVSCACGTAGTETFKYGNANSHNYNQKNTSSRYLKNAATCTSSAEYYLSCECGEKGTATFIYGGPLDHTYSERVASSRYLKSAATCTSPAEYYMSCECGEKGTRTFTYGNALGHNWRNATTTSPMTCTTCGATSGQPLGVYLTDLTPSGKYGKLYYHVPGRVNFSTNLDYNDIYTPGHLSYASDTRGNSYTCGLHLDGPKADPYYVEYNLGGQYTTFTATLAPDSGTSNSRSAVGYQKYIKIFCDGTRVYTSPAMTTTSRPEYININVSGVRILRIEYSTTTGSNDIATVFDPRVQ